MRTSLLESKLPRDLRCLGSKTSLTVMFDKLAKLLLLLGSFHLLLFSLRSDRSEVVEFRLGSSPLFLPPVALDHEPSALANSDPLVCDRLCLAGDIEVPRSDCGDANGAGEPRLSL